METPMPFITTNPTTGTWEVSEAAVTILHSIIGHIAVVAIVGKYRTGKSYLMNRIFGSNSGFALGSTTEAKTKGIWVWARPHPKDTDKCLILLDVEGFMDSEKGDTHHDTQLFTMAVLLCNCLVYNAMGTIDEVIIQQLRLVAELTEHIQIKRGTESEEEGIFFSQYFPNFYLALRDFFLEPTVNGEEVTPDQYLEHHLRPKGSMSTKAQEYNAPRDGIKAFFPKRRCFTFVKPVNDESDLRHMDSIDESIIKAEFLENCRAFVASVLTETATFNLDCIKLTTRRFTTIAAEYVRAMNTGSVPCIESTVEVMKNSECKKAMEEALHIYEQMMRRDLKDTMPIGTEELLKMHAVRNDEAVEHYREVSVFDAKGSFIEKLVEDINATRSKFIHSNNECSTERSSSVLQECFRELEQSVSDGTFALTGGYNMYEKVRDNAMEKYKKSPRLGPMRDHVLNEYLEKIRPQGQTTLATDKALSEKDKQLIEENENTKHETEKARLAEIRTAEVQRELEQEQQERKDAIKKMQADMAETHSQQIQEYKSDLIRKTAEHSKMVADGLLKQARYFQLIIDEIQKERWQMEKNHKIQTDLLKEYNQQHQRSANELRKQLSTVHVTQLLHKTHKLMIDMEQCYTKVVLKKPGILAEVRIEESLRQLTHPNEKKEFNAKLDELMDQRRKINIEMTQVKTSETTDLDDIKRELGALENKESSIRTLINHTMEEMEQNTAIQAHIMKENPEFPFNILKQKFEFDKETADLTDKQLVAYLLEKTKELTSNMQELDTEVLEESGAICSAVGAEASRKRQFNPIVIKLKQKMAMPGNQILNINRAIRRVKSPKATGLDDLKKKLKDLEKIATDTNTKIRGEEKSCVIQ